MDVTGSMLQLNISDGKMEATRHVRRTVALILESVVDGSFWPQRPYQKSD